MQNRMTSRRRPGATDKPDAASGKTTTAQGEDQHPVPRMPHERDESVDSAGQQEPSGQRMGRLGQQDMERGLADTTKGRELDATYDRLREDMPDGEKKFRP